MSQKVENKNTKAKRNTFNVDEELEEQLSFKDLKRVLSYVKPYRKQVLFALVVILIANLAALISPLLVRQAIDYAIPNADTTYLFILAGIFLAAVVTGGLCASYRIKNIARIGQNVLRDIRLDLFTHLQTLSFDFFDSRPHGKILIRVVNYINTLSDLFSNGLINLISDLFSVVIALIFMFTTDVRFTLYSLLFIPVLVLLVLLIKNAQRRNFQRLSNKQSNMNAYIHESIAGIRTSQSFMREKENTDIFDEVQDEYRDSWMKAVAIMFMMHPAVQKIAILATAMVYIVGALHFGNVSLGVIIAFTALLGSFWNPIVNIGNFYNSLVTGSAYLERIFETMDEVPAVMDTSGAVEMPTIKGDICFNNVRFGYEEIEILKGLNFNVEAGETIALVGPTGAGKSTIINLVSRFYNINSGTISIDGHDISKMKLESLRSQMGVMLQDTFIFSGTITENIRYGKLDATEEEIIAAAKAVQAHEFISGMKDGYETEINERGSNLSAGQRQLLSFARTLLADPKILILDEATASIDTKTEALLQAALDRLLEGRTSFIIAHRLSTIKNASRIFYINGGVLQEAGSHDELMEIEGGYYRKLYESQFATA